MSLLKTSRLTVIVVGIFILLVFIFSLDWLLWRYDIGEITFRTDYSPYNGRIREQVELLGFTVHSEQHDTSWSALIEQYEPGLLSRTEWFTATVEARWIMGNSEGHGKGMYCLIAANRLSQILTSNEFSKDATHLVIQSYVAILSEEYPRMDILNLADVIQKLSESKTTMITKEQVEYVLSRKN
jgi:hypothetical protein